MAKILVAEDDKDIRNLLVDILDDVGYEAPEAKNGADAVEQIQSSQPDLLLLDLMMPVMDGFEVLNRLRDNPETSDMPVVILSAVPSRKGELRAWRLGVRHYIPKPFASERVHLSVKIALREADEAQTEAALAAGQTGVIQPAQITENQSATESSGAAVDSSFIRTSHRALNELLGGGIVPGSLVLIEGDTKSGKSVISQNLVFDALQKGMGVQYFTTGGSSKRLVKRMHSIGLDVSGHVREDRLVVSEMTQPKLQKSSWEINPGKILQSLMSEMEDLPSELDIIVLDDLTDQLDFASSVDADEFITDCRNLADNGKTVILTTQSHSLEGEKRDPTEEASDLRMELELIKIVGTEGTLLKLLKSSTVEIREDSQIAFKVAKKVGIERLDLTRTRN
ncbi:MAG: response regulator [SAR202 cluster bacterium]|jgi:archaellum biogenesis ATPase FlaH/DNA-binding response OmpR family regulator|nr:response regulator [SAR202 cluster bacterium]